MRVAYAGSRQGPITESGSGALNIHSNSLTSHNLFLRSGLEGSKEWRFRGIPIRSSAHAEWIHNFTSKSRPLDVHWEGQPSTPWSISSTRGQPDTIKLGAALEIGISDRKTIRIYSEHEFFKQGSSTYFGATLSIGL